MAHRNLLSTLTTLKKKFCKSSVIPATTTPSPDVATAHHNIPRQQNEWHWAGLTRDLLKVLGLGFWVSSAPDCSLSFAAKRPPKRKRVPAEGQNVQNAPAHSSYMRPSASTSHVTMSTKKARKRQRRLERQALEAEEKHQNEVWFNNASAGSSDQGLVLPSQSWPNDSMSFGMFQPSLPSYVAPPYAAVPDYPAFPIASSSSWVSSMALAAEVPAEEWPPYQPTPPILPSTAQPRPISGSRKQRRSTVTEQTPLPVQPLPPKPTLASVPSIGMKPEQDASSKHGLFQIPTSSSSTSTYIPNPARTLVMEQLPKSHRHADFINSWCKKVCGAHPIYLSIDAPRSKVLIEFATAELARKAWGSPRLGQHLTGLSAHKLKGKPREDLIKVWWYRVDGVGAGAGVGEIEEGEIEGDAAEKELEVPVKKETKKERKARLAKERLVKLAKLQNAEVPPVSPHVPTIPLASSSLPPKPNQYAYSDPSICYPQPLGSSHVLSQYTLLSLATPDSQWRQRHPLPERPDQTSYGASAAPSLGGGSPINSSRSPSPISDIRGASVQPQLSADSSEMEDMEVDQQSPGTDMFVRLPTSLLATNHVERVGLTPQVERFTLDPVAPVPVRPPAGGSRAHGISPLLGMIPDISRPLLSPVVVSTPLVSPPLSASATPPLAPSEPRAMKNAPKGPSYTKRSLMARQKELEERIARSRTELAIATGNSIPSTGPAISTTPSGQSGAEPDKQAMEERLRMLVLQSQKKKVKALSSATPVTNGSVERLTQPPTPVSSSSSPLLAPASSTSASLGASETFSLDDLAVSFITETIQTVKSSTTLALARPLPPPSGASPMPSSKSELAIRQQRLEKYIAESKVLMDQLTQARTKKEKDLILATMRERSRCVSAVWALGRTMEQLSILFFSFF